jgi:tyramine---L-glutamate ligase
MGRPNILLVEWASSGGCWVDGLAFSEENVFLHHGRAMLRAFAEDLAQAGFPTTVLIDVREQEPQTWPTSRQILVDGAERFWRVLNDEAARSDLILLIAPEEGGWLQRCHQELRGCEDKFLSPSGDFLTTACSKHATSERLRERGVQRLVGKLYGPAISTWPPVVSLPAIMKPDDGAGGTRQIVRDWDEVKQPTSGIWRIEPFIAGKSVSIAAICGAGEPVLLEPLEQIFEPPTDGIYVGGEFPLEEPLRRRAQSLASRGFAALGKARGFVGLDLVLHEFDESCDAIVDVNPRLTCSYIGLRQIYSTNLADALVRNHGGEPVRLQLNQKPISFRL